MLVFSALLLACCIQPPLPEKENLISSTFTIEFNENALSIKEQSLIRVFSNNLLILNSVGIDIICPNNTVNERIQKLRQLRIARITELLVAEGADASQIKTRQISSEQEILRLKLNELHYQVVVSYPEHLHTGINSRKKNPLCGIDTTVFDASGNGISLKVCDLIARGSSIQLKKAPSISELNELSQQDIDVLNRFKLENEHHIETEILIPTHPGNSRNSMQLEEFSTEHKRWIIQGNASIQLKTIHRVTFLSTRLNSSGIYRITCIPKSKSEWQIIHAPEGFGILSATVSNADSISFPATRILGGNAVAFMINKKQQEYKMNLTLISANGDVSKIESLPLGDCYKKSISTKKWEYSKDLKAICGARTPKKAGIIQAQK